MSAITNSTASVHYQCNSCKNDLSSDQIKKCNGCKSAIYCGFECQKADWKAHKIVCLAKPYTEENRKIRAGFAAGNEHIENTRKAILEGAGHLNPEKSIVVVCGAQCYEGGFVEPLPELLAKCKKLVLVDVDPVSLEELHRRLDNSPKVSTVVLDLSASLKNITNFRNETALITNRDVFLEKMADF